MAAEDANDGGVSGAGQWQEGCRILVVDDHLSFCRLMKQRLERENHHVTVAHSVEGGRAALESRFDVVVLDVSLPDGDGFELVDLLRKASTPTSVVMMTGSPSEDSLKHSLNQGILEFLFKPFKFGEVQSAVNRAVEAQRRWHERIARLEGHTHGADASDSFDQDSPDLPADEIVRLTHVLAERYALSDRERETLELILKGLQNSEIAAGMNISGNTVKYHARNLLTKLGMESRTELFRSLLQHAK